MGVERLQFMHISVQKNQNTYLALDEPRWECYYRLASFSTDLGHLMRVHTALEWVSEKNSSLVKDGVPLWRHNDP